MKFVRIAAPLAPLFAAVLSLVPMAVTHAAGVQSITLSPSATNLTINAGTPATRNLTLVDDGDTDYPAKLYVEPYHVQNITYDPQFTRLPGTTDASAWVTLSQTSVALTSHGTATVSYTVNAPKNTAPGGYYAVIFAQTSGQSDGGGVSAQNRVGNILYITVSGDSKISGTVTSAALPSFTFGTSVPIGLNVTNTGGIHFQSDTHINVASILGNTVYTADTTHYVLPQTTRLITSNWTPVAPIGIYKVTRSSTINGDATALPAATIIVARPSFLPLLLFILLTLGGIFLILKHRHDVKRRTKKASGSKTDE